MITISKDLVLQPISIQNHQEIYDLMRRIYPPAYTDYWEDNGEWYVNNSYSFDNFQKELNEENTAYYFILLESKTIGILRLAFNINTNYEFEEGYVKLHRLYIDQAIQNQGIGKKTLDWLVHYVTETGYKKLWLEAMEKQPQALHFYKKYGFKEVAKVFLEFPLLYSSYRGMFKMLKEL